MKNMTFNLVVKLDFEALTMAQIAKLERYFSDGMESQKGFTKMDFVFSRALEPVRQEKK